MEGEVAFLLSWTREAPPESPSDPMGGGGRRTRPQLLASHPLKIKISCQAAALW